jgi:hypothetical protein
VPKNAAKYLFTFPDFLEYLGMNRPSMEVVGNYLRHELAPAWAMFENRFELKMWCQERLAAALPQQARLARELRERLMGPGPPDGYEHPSLRKWHRSQKGPLVVDPSVDTVDTPKFSPEAYALVKFESLLDWFRRKRITLLVVYIPNCPAAEKRWAEVEPAMIDAIARACDAHRVPFLRCDREDLPRTDDDFIDAGHVDLALARRISSRAARYADFLGLLDNDGPRLAGTGDPDAAAP